MAETYFWMTKSGDIAPADPGQTALGIQVANLEQRFDRNYLGVVNAGTTSATLTAANVLNNILTAAPAAAATLTLPTAASVVALDGNSAVGRGFKFHIINTNGTNAITVAAGTGITLVGVVTVAASSSATFYASYTNVTVGQEAITVYRLA